MHQRIARLLPVDEEFHVFELGSRDGEDTVKLAEAFPKCIIHTFEANPEQHGKVARRISASQCSDRIRFMPKAVWSETATISFRINRTDNVGASSVFPSTGNYDHIEKYELDEPIEVPCVALSDYVRETGCSPRVIWSDLQGADLHAFAGLGEYIRDVHLIYTEMNCVQMYEGAPTFADIHQFMWDNGFGLAYYKAVWHMEFGDGIFVKRPVVSPGG